MRTRVFFGKAGGLAGLAALLVATGCGPALVQTEEFTPKKIREIKFGDTCKLQPYFNANSDKLFKRSEVSVGADGADKKAGKMTFEIKQGPQSDTFYRLVDATYKRVPKVDRSAPMAATVAFLHRKGQLQMPIGATIVVETGEQEYELPYSPCMGAFFFGRGYYVMRAKLLTPGAIHMKAAQVSMSRLPVR